MSTTGDFDAAWSDLSPKVLTVMMAGQSAAADEAMRYIPAVLEEQGLPNNPVAKVNPRSVVGVAGSGVPLEDVLPSVLTRFRKILAETEAMEAAQQAAGALLDGIVTTQVADASRAVESVEIAARPEITGMVRCLQLPSCSRCVILAGRFYRWSKGFERHPRCFPAGVVVSGPAARAATRRWYEGELSIIRTASGQELPTTGNHPVLTDRGWVPANLVQEGDYVVRSVLSEGAVPLVVPDEQQVPSRIEDLWRPDIMMSLVGVPTTTEDFHGDGGHGEVDVVLRDRLLRDGFQSPISQPPHHHQLSGGVAQSLDFAGQASSLQLLERADRAASGGVGRGSLSLSFLRGLASGPQSSGFGTVADLNAFRYQSPADHVAGHADAIAEGKFAFSSTVGSGDVSDRQDVITPRWDAPAAPFSVESRTGYASRGKDLLERLGGQVALDRVIENRRVSWSGPVYNLTSSEGWYNANGLIVSNCDCFHLPAAQANSSALHPLATDPRGAIEAGLVTGLSKADTKAIVEGGASPSRVINAHRGMATAQVPTQGKVKYTTTGDGAPKRGRRPRGQRPVPELRLRPESIYRIAGDDRLEAQRLLHHFGYLKSAPE